MRARDIGLQARAISASASRTNMGGGAFMARDHLWHDRSLHRIDK